MALRKKTYWERMAAEILTQKELERMMEFASSLGISEGTEKMDLLYEAFFRAKNSILKSDIDFEKMGEPKRTQLLEATAYVWYLEGYPRGKAIVPSALEAFQKDETIDSLVAGISNEWSRAKVSSMLKNNEERYTGLAKERLREEVPEFLRPYIPPKPHPVIEILKEEISEEPFATVDSDVGPTLSAEIVEGEKPAFLVSADSLKAYLISGTVSFDNWVKSEYEAFNAKEQGLSFECFRQGMIAYLNALEKGDLIKTNIFTIIDYSKPSYEKRMFVLDMENKTILKNMYVTHGTKPGAERKRYGVNPPGFSNEWGTNWSSLGLMVTARSTFKDDTHGNSLHIYGKEEGINDNVFGRGIYFHRSTYARGPAQRSGGYRLGGSKGCPAVDDRIADEIFDIIKGGSAVFVYADPEIYSEAREYINSSDYQKIETAQMALTSIAEKRLASAREREEAKKL